jgi:uncharacterized delta-60 repeat protein
MKMIKCLLLIPMAVLAASLLYAAPGDVDPTFYPGSGVNAAVNSVVALPGNKLLIGGEFTTVRNASRKGIARINPDGSADPTFDPGSGANGPVLVVATLPDGKILVGGAFTKINNTARNGLARLNNNGTLDDAFNPAANAGASINALAVLADGKIIVAGEFEAVAGTSRKRIARLNADGTLDTTFSPGGGADGTINAVMLQPDGKVVIAGAFRVFDEIKRGGVARLEANGALDGTFDPGAALEADGEYVSCLGLQGDKILAGGSFEAFNKAAHTGIVRLTSTGVLDETFQYSNTPGDVVDCMLVLPDRSLMLGGFGAASPFVFVKLDADGSPAADFTPPFNFGWAGGIALLPDGKTAVAAKAEVATDATVHGHLARVNADGSYDSTFVSNSGENSWVLGVVGQPDGKVIVAGDFTGYGTMPVNGLIRLNADGAVDTSFIYGTGVDFFCHTKKINPHR